jgi:RNA polymerase sigma-70 factor (ECF subfamily)
LLLFIETYKTEKPMDDSLLILLAKDGNESAFRSLYERYREPVYYLAYRYVKCREDAEDLLQSTFIKAFRSIGSFRNENDQAFHAWLNRICVNCALNMLKKQKLKRRFTHVSFSDGSADSVDRSQSPEDRYQTEQHLNLVQKAISDLPPKQQLIFKMRHHEHLEISKIAQRLKCSESNVKTQLLRARDKMRKKLALVWREA